MNELQEVTLLKDKDWSAIDGELCRVLEFTTLGAVVEDGQVKAASKSLPYASVVIECKKIQGRVTGYIAHKIDFAMLWAAFNERAQVKGAHVEIASGSNGTPVFVAKHGVATNEEVLLVWTQKNYISKIGLVNKFLPRLIVMVSPKGAYDILLDPKSRPELKGEAWAYAIAPLVTWKPIAMRK